MGYLLELRPSLGPALVVGGGAVAARKVRGLVAGGFAITVVAPDVEESIIAAGAKVLRRRFESGDVAGHALVLACTDDRGVNQAVGEAARAAGVPVVVADSQDESTAFTPAIYRDGALTVAVSTGGGAPRVAAEIRDELAEALGRGAGARVEGAAGARRAAVDGDSDD